MKAGYTYGSFSDSQEQFSDVFCRSSQIKSEAFLRQELLSVVRPVRWIFSVVIHGEKLTPKNQIGETAAKETIKASIQEISREVLYLDQTKRNNNSTKLQETSTK